MEIGIKVNATEATKERELTLTDAGDTTKEERNKI